MQDFYGYFLACLLVDCLFNICEGAVADCTAYCVVANYFYFLPFLNLLLTHVINNVIINIKSTTGSITNSPAKTQ